MCGVAGAFGAPIDPDRIDATLRLMAQRGPDGQGVLRTDLGGQTVTLLHTRLSIIDLDERAAQPFERGDVAVSFNGEIYNYRELRRELEARGVRFTTTSDTEVLLEAYRAWGTAAFDRLEGMWALALIDRHNGTLILSRDRFGEKPLYIMQRHGTLYFASEIKALAALSGAWPAVDYGYVARALVMGYRVLHKTAQDYYKGVTNLPAASFAVLKSPGAPDPEKYWSLRYDTTPMTAADAAEGVRERLLRSVELRMRADVPLAFSNAALCRIHVPASSSTTRVSATPAETPS